MKATKGLFIFAMGTLTGIFVGAQIAKKEAGSTPNFAFYEGT